MPRIARKEIPDCYTAYTAARVAANETNDCAVIAIAAATGTDYATVRDLLAAAGRKTRHGTQRAASYLVLDKLGFDRIPVVPEMMIAQYPKAHQILKSVTSHHPRRFNKIWSDGNTYLFFFSGHVAAVIDGTLIDWSINRALQCTEIYKIVRRTPAPVAAPVRLAAQLPNS